MIAAGAALAAWLVVLLVVLWGYLALTVAPTGWQVLVQVLSGLAWGR